MQRSNCASATQTTRLLPLVTPVRAFAEPEKEAAAEGGNGIEQ